MLWRKMYRDIKENKGAYIACITIIVIGLMVFSSFSIVMDNLKSAQNNFYEKQNFADGYAEIGNMPLATVKSLESLEGIKEVQGRLIKDVRVFKPDSEENVYLRLVSIDPEKSPPINGVFLEKGKPLNENELNIWVDGKFFAANNLELNDTIDIIAEGKKRSLRVVGAGYSPEFIYAMKNSSDFFPDPKAFGIAYLPSNMMKTLFEEGSSVNSIVFTLNPGVEYKDVEDRMKPELNPYGLKNIYPRKDQPSHVMLSQELKQLEGMSKSLPAIFLAVACMILYIMLKRTIENQRGQIGILKAFGYTRKEITLHYMSYALIIGFIGGILGGILGILISFKYTELYNAYFNIPGLKSGFSVTYLFMSIILALVFSLFAGYQGCKGALALEPAEAMRPPSPPLGKKVILEKISFFWNSLNVQGKMALRNMTRHPGRSIFVFLGITFTFSLMGSPWSIWDLTQRMLFDQYEKVEIYDAKISLATPLEQSQIERELMRFPGVKEVESRTEIPVTLKNKWYKKDVILMGLKNDSQLHRILDKDYNRMKIPVKGILLSERLAELLGAKVGTKLTFTSLMAKNPDKQIAIEVTGIVPQYMGLNAYMELEALQSLLEQGHIATSVMLRIDENNLALLQKKYQNSAAILNIDDKNKLLSKSKELMATNSTTIYILLIIGIITGFAIVYNSSIITVSERSRELASMMVLGMTPSEVLSVITFEQWFISIFGMLAGIPMTKLFLIGMANSTSNDVYTMPTTLSNSSIIAAFVVTAACIWVAQRAAAKKIKGLSLVDVLKARE